MTQDPIDAAELDALAAVAPALASTVVCVGSDIALVVDPEGIVRSVAAAEAGLAAAAAGWTGRPWVDTVIAESRRKIELLLADARRSGAARRREVNHPGSAGVDIPVAYAGVRLGENGPLLAVGRDLRVAAAVQQRFVNAQHALELEAVRRRQVESRYRLLFQVSADPVLLLDAATLKVVDANRAAVRLFGEPDARPFDGGGLPGLHGASRQALVELIGRVRSGAAGGSVHLRLDGQPEPLQLTISALTAEAGPLLVLRAGPVGEGTPAATTDRVPAPAPAVVTDIEGRVLAAHPTVLRLAGLDDDASLRGRPLAAALGALGGVLGTLLERVRESGGTADARPTDTRALLEVAAHPLADAEVPSIAFALRVLDAPPAPPTGALDALGSQVGRVPLPRLLREASALIEQQLIRIALERAGPDLDAVAASLEISRDSLDLRLRRLGMGGPHAAGKPPPR
jgi:transcriptional regulator PpsR